MGVGNGPGSERAIANEIRLKTLGSLKDGPADLVVAPTPDGTYYEQAGAATLFADLTSIEGTRKSLGSLLPTSTIYMASERVKARPDIAQHLANAFVRALQFINSHTPEEVMAVIPNEIVGKDRTAYLAALKEEMPMFATDGRMPPQDAAKELQVLSEFNAKFKSVKVGETYTNAFVDEALRRYR